MRDRLIELEKNITTLKIHGITHKPVQHITTGEKYEVQLIHEIVEDVTNLLNKIKNGTLIELPCNIDDTLYYPWIYDGTSGIAILEVSNIKIYVQGRCLVFYKDAESDMPMPNFFTIEDFGKTVFLTKEGAERALKECEGK